MERRGFLVFLLLLGCYNLQIFLSRSFVTGGAGIAPHVCYNLAAQRSKRRPVLLRGAAAAANVAVTVRLGANGPQTSDGASRMQAVIFDADGTLLDSLPPHVSFCRRASAAHGAGLEDKLPALDDLRGMRSIAAAPMDNFLRRAGFPEELVGVINEEYMANFAADFPVRPFAGVPALLASLDDANIDLAVVTSNTEVNVRQGLGASCSHFRFVLGIDNGPANKVDSIAEALRLLDLCGTDVIYVGDTIKDYACAIANGLRFVGSSYGFEDLAALAERGQLDKSAGVAASVKDLKEILLRELGREI